MHKHKANVLHLTKKSMKGAQKFKRYTTKHLTNVGAGNLKIQSYDEPKLSTECANENAIMSRQ